MAAACCVEDYNKGLLTPDVCRRIIELARKRDVPTFVDPYALPDYSKYRGATVVTPNRVETERATGLPCQDESHYRAAAERPSFTRPNCRAGSSWHRRRRSRCR